MRVTKSTSWVNIIQYRLGRFLEYLGNESIYDQDRHTLSEYLDNVAAQCRHYHRGIKTTKSGWSQFNTCTKKLPLDCQNCPAREALRKQSVSQHVVAVKKLYTFLTDLEHIPVNVAQAMSDAWWEQNKRLVRKERATKAPKRFLSRAEARQWIDGTPEIQWATFQLLALRYGFRASEMVRLCTAPGNLDPDLAWIRVPQAPGNDGKRINTEAYPIDEEIRRHLGTYLRWRDARLQRVGRTSTRLFLDPYGRDYKLLAFDASRRINPVLRRTATQAGLDNPESVSSHIGRRFLSDEAQQRGIHGNDLKMIRGDFLQSEATGNYTDTGRLASIWRAASPPLGIRAPKGYFMQ